MNQSCASSSSSRKAATEGPPEWVPKEPSSWVADELSPQKQPAALWKMSSQTHANYSSVSIECFMAQWVVLSTFSTQHGCCMLSLFISISRLKGCSSGPLWMQIYSLNLLLTAVEAFETLFITAYSLTYSESNADILTFLWKDSKQKFMWDNAEKDIHSFYFGNKKAPQRAAHNT